MRVQIISDMEGVAGIVKWEQVTAGDEMYKEGRLTEEINAAVRGAKAAGGDEILVMDHHGAGRAGAQLLIPDLLDPACEYVVQSSGPSTPSFSSRAATRAC